MRFSIPRNARAVVGGGDSWVRVEGDELPHPMLVRLGLGGDGRLVATGVIIEAENELTTRDLRIPLAGIVSAFAQQASKPATQKRLYLELFGYENAPADDAWERWAPKVPDGFPEWWPATSFLSVADLTTPVQRVKPGRRGYPDDHYRRIAKAYMRARKQHPRAPIRALMTEEHATEPTVHRWLRIARERGYLKDTR